MFFKITQVIVFFTFSVSSSSHSSSIHATKTDLYDFSSEPEATHPMSDILIVMTDPLPVFDGRATRSCYLQVHQYDELDWIHFQTLSWNKKA